MTLCERCIHGDICAIQCGYDEGDERALTYCSEFKSKDDVVEVVRCKDCKHWKQVNEERHACYYHGSEMDYDEYCSYGERKDN